MKRRPLHKRQLSLQTLETRRVLAASLGWDGPGLGTAELTYTIGNTTASLSRSEVESAIETALDAWSSAAEIQFVQTSQIGLRDSLDIKFTNIDGPGGTIAQAYLPDDVNPARIAGDIEFDAAEVWEVGNSIGSRTFDLVWVAVHEIGHALGLDHSGAAGSVLAPFVSPNQQFASLAATDASAIQELYAAGDGTSTLDDTVEVPIDPPPTDTTEDDASDDADTPGDDADRNDRRFNRRGWGRWWFRFGRLDADVPAHHNLYNPTDVNDDGNTTALDALTIINQLTRVAGGAEGESIDAMCDTNGDGFISAVDALMVINKMSQGESESSSEINTGVEDTIVVGIDDTRDPEDDETDDNTDEGDSGEDDPVVDDTDDGDDDMEETDEEETDEEETDEEETDEEETDEEETDEEETDEEEADEEETDGEETDEEDPVIIVDTEDPEDDSQDSEDGDDESDVGDDMDGADDEDDEMDEHCVGGRFGHGHRHGRHGFGLKLRDAEQWVTRWDANEDGGLTEDEVPGFVWEYLIDQEVDADGDGTVTIEELQSAIDAAGADRFNELDANGDGLLQEEEVSAKRWSKISAADTDGDLGVSMDELDTWRENRISERNQDDPAASDVDHVVDQVFAQIGRMAPQVGGVRSLFGGRFR